MHLDPLVASPDPTTDPCCAPLCQMDLWRCHGGEEAAPSLMHQSSTSIWAAESAESKPAVGKKTRTPVPPPGCRREEPPGDQTHCHLLWAVGDSWMPTAFLTQNPLDLLPARLLPTFGAEIFINLDALSYCYNHTVSVIPFLTAITLNHETAIVWLEAVHLILLGSPLLLAPSRNISICAGLETIMVHNHHCVTQLHPVVRRRQPL